MPEPVIVTCTGQIALPGALNKWCSAEKNIFLVTSFQWADFVVWTLTEMFVERVVHPSGFAEQQLEKLKYFYLEHLLPVLYAGTV